MKASKIRQIQESLENILNKVHRDQKRNSGLIKEVHPTHQKSATNLINYISLRSFDLRDLQRKLGYLGMSRLARAEAHVEASLKTSLYFLHKLLQEEYLPPNKYTISIKRSEKQLEKNTSSLLGTARKGRRERVMVTMSGKDAGNTEIIRSLINNGMDIARLNCAHDNSEVWLQMINDIKKTSTELGTQTAIAMDISGPKIRTGELADKALYLSKGQILRLTKNKEQGHNELLDKNGNLISPAQVSCTLSEVFDYIKKGDPVFFDDGSIEGQITNMTGEFADVEITRVQDEKGKLKADKGINFPKSDLKIHGLTASDKEHLRFIAKHADFVNFSFVNTPEDVREMQDELRKLNALDKLGVVYKIETQEAYNNLIDILLEAMKAPKVGVMIARGDLAIEAGWKRMGRIQKEMLAICNACHLPIIWATQVLENLAKKGLPSRSEITDAVNATKSECIMLNKGPHIIQALELLNQLITNTEEYQDKNAPMLPKLRKIRRKIEA